jgi:hypothetical protein
MPSVFVVVLGRIKVQILQHTKTRETIISKSMQQPTTQINFSYLQERMYGDYSHVVRFIQYGQHILLQAVPTTNSR